MDRRTFLTLVLPATTAVAQTPTDSSVPPRLSGILSQARWTPGTARTLLIIGGKQTQAMPPVDYDTDENFYQDYYTRQRQETLAQLGPPPAGGYALAAVAAAFGRKVARYGRIAALVPTTRKGLVLSPGAPRQNAEPLYVSSFIDQLDDAALKKLLSESGLGREDLPKSLLSLFDALFPQSEGIGLSEGKDRPFIPLDREIFQRARMRVSLVSNVTAFQGEQYLGILTSEGKPIPAVDLFSPVGLHLAMPPGTVRTPMARTTYGQQLIRRTATAPLPESLPLPGENRLISLERVSTLKELIARVQEAESCELVLPPTITTWSVEWRGEPNVRTEEVLRALLATTNGVFRQVGSRYVLADSQVPLGPRLEKLCQWMDRSSAQLSVQRKREFLPIEWGRFEPSDPCPLTLPWLERIADAGPYVGLTMPMREFASNTALQKLIESHQASLPSFVPTHLKVSVNWMAYLLLPGREAISWQKVYGFGRKRPVKSVTLSLKQTWPILRASTPEEARSAVHWAKKQGALGIALEGVNEALAAAIAEKALPVRRVHRLWKADATTPDALRERTIQGQLSDWLSPTDPKAQRLVQKRLQDAVLPGLDGLLVCDTQPPGYCGYGNGSDGLALLGYTEANRQAFLSEHQRDILDIAPAHCYTPLLGYAPWVSSTSREQWVEWRTDRMRHALNQLSVAINCPAWLEGGITPGTEAEKRFGSMMPGWFTRWAPLKQYDELWQSGYTQGEKLSELAKSVGKDPWLRIPVSPDTKRATLEGYLGALEFEAGEGWQGKYLDFTSLSLGEAQELLTDKK